MLSISPSQYPGCYPRRVPAGSIILLDRTVWDTMKIIIKSICDIEIGPRHYRIPDRGTIIEMCFVWFDCPTTACEGAHDLAWEASFSCKKFIILATPGWLSSLGMYIWFVGWRYVIIAMPRALNGSYWFSWIARINIALLISPLSNPNKRNPTINSQPHIAEAFILQPFIQWPSTIVSRYMLVRKTTGSFRLWWFCWSSRKCEITCRFCEARKQRPLTCTGRATIMHPPFTRSPTSSSPGCGCKKGSSV